MISKRLFIGWIVNVPVALCLAQSDPPALRWQAPVPINVVNDIAFDILGNSIVTGSVAPDGDGRSVPHVISFRPSGEIRWTFTYSPTSTFRGEGLRLGSDLDGNIYVAVVARVDTASLDRPAVLAISPDGNLRWSTVLPQAQGANKSGAANRLAIDGEGIVYVSGYESPSQNVFVGRLNPAAGQLEWVYRAASPVSSVIDIATDRAGRLYGAFTAGSQAIRTIGFDPVASNGSPLRWLDTVISPAVLSGNSQLKVTLAGDIRVCAARHVLSYSPAGVQQWTYFDRLPFNVDAIEVDRAGNLYCSGRGVALACSVSPTGTVRWTSTGLAYTGPDATCITLDRLGNPYIGGRSGASAGFLKKLDRDTGANAWNTAIGRNAPVRAAAVDNGTGIGLATAGEVARYEQQYIDIPEVYRNAVDFRIEQASIWHPDFPSFEFEHPFGTEDMCWNQASSNGCQYNFQFDDVDEQRSAAGWGGRVQARTDGRMRFGFRAEATGGSVDIAYPGEAEIIVAGAEKWNRGKPVTIQTSWTPSPNAGLTGRGKPTLNAGIVASGHVNMLVNARVWSPEESLTLVNQSAMRNLDPATYIVSIFGLGGGFWQSGVWLNMCEPTNYVCGNWRIPPLDVNARLVNGQMSSNAADLFMAVRGNLTQILSVNTLGIPTILRWPPARRPEQGDGFDAYFEARVMQAYIQHTFAAIQNITWTPQPKIRFEWSNPDFPSHELALGEDLNFTIPQSFNGQVTATPVLSVDGTFRNNTTIRFIPNLGFESLALSANVSAGRISVFSVEECYGCIRTPDPGLPPFPGYDRSYDLSPDEKTMAPIQINGTGLASEWPKVYAASRETLPMILYDQFSPRQSDFNGLVNRNSRLLVFGKFFLATYNPVARIEHLGRVETLPTTRLNNDTLLVEIPNRFRLLPGVARLSVQNTVGNQTRDSNKIDLPIEYPIPNLATVNPNLWAADPALKTVPVSVIDGLSSAGNHTFIARRDYYLVLRDQLWNASTAGGVGAAAYFEEFDFNDPPGFPSVLFGGVPLSRFEQPVDNGIHNVRLPEALYAAPSLVNIVLQNPPPVEAPSQTLQLNIAAPRPVISGFEPPTVPPGEAFTLIVKGPANVPFWQGYEEPKYGNFTAASVVLWDGIELPTTFIHSGALQVEVPQELVQQAGYHHITVETAAGGSVYFEQLRTGDGAIVWQGPVPSGCSINAAGDVLCGSDPMVFAVEYPQPFIENVAPSVLDACAAAGPDQPFVDLSIAGTGFAPDCRLFLDGTLRQVVRESAERLLFTLSSADLAALGVRSLYIENPGPYGGVSNEMTLEVVLTDCNANGRPDQCEINDGLASDCNGNRIPDSCDIAQGDSADTNGNGIPDECESGSPCRGDLDGDRDVDISDLATLLARFGMPGGATASDGDSDADGDVDLSDLSVLLGSFGAPCE